MFEPEALNVRLDALVDSLRDNATLIRGLPAPAPVVQLGRLRPSQIGSNFGIGVCQRGFEDLTPHFRGQTADVAIRLEFDCLTKHAGGTDKLERQKNRFVVNVIQALWDIELGSDHPLWSTLILTGSVVEDIERTRQEHAFEVLDAVMTFQITTTEGG